MMTPKQILKILKSAKNVAIFAHKNPDPDACGSLFGLKGLCDALKIDATVFIEPREENYLDKIFPMSNSASVFDDKYDLICLVDTHDAKMLPLDVENKNCVIIDHHLVAENDTLVTENVYIEPKASNSQMILSLFRVENISPNADVATYLYAGIIGDTSRFLHNNLSEEVFADASTLLSCGANAQKVYDFMFRYKSLEQLRVEKYFLNHLKFCCDGKFAYIIFTEKARKKIGASLDDLKTLANRMTSIRGVKASFLCMEYSKNFYKFSTRCNTGFDVNKFCVKFGGGGHVCASGCEMKITKHQIERKIQAWALEIVDEK